MKYRNQVERYFDLNIYFCFKHRNKRHQYDEPCGDESCETRAELLIQNCLISDGNSPILS